jgi:hypothetical protein
MAFATITATRNERPKFLAFCKYQLSRMNTKPDKSYFIDYPAIDGKVDLVLRIKKGIELAKADGFELVFIVEDDDFYSKNYFDNIPDADFIGEPETFYYNLRNNTYQVFDHPKRSSLFTTGFKISAIEDFRWPHDEYKNLDVALWAHNQKKQIAWRSTGAIGIKHGQGLCGGNGHKWNMKNKDKDWEWLSEHCDPESYAFYKTLEL